MFGLETLDVLIGLVTVYLILGLACTAVVEALAAWMSVRSKNLEDALNEFFAGDLDGTRRFAAAFFEHPLIQTLSKGRNGRPSYIPPEIVGEVVESLLLSGGAAASLAAAVGKLPGTAQTNRVKGLLEALVARAGGSAADFRKAVEGHFNAVMDRASGWFKRRQQGVALGVAALLAFGGNVDTFAIATALASNPEARAKMVALAEAELAAAEAAGEPEGGGGQGGLAAARQRTMEAKETLARAKADLASAGLRFGWPEGFGTGSIGGWLAKLLGLAVSTLAVSLGAPFWFDVLQRFMQVRAAGTRAR
jgi:hypothetical protein